MEAVQSGGRYTASNPLFTSIGGGTPPSTTRSWTDQNRNLVPDCDLLNPGDAGPARHAAATSAGRWPIRASAR